MVDLLQLEGSNFAREMPFILPIRLAGSFKPVDTLGRGYFCALDGGIKDTRWQMTTATTNIS